MPTKSVPAEACFFRAEVQFGDNGEAAKTIPVQLTARSGDAIDHPWWGKVVHDLNGMQLHKSRLPIDYAHAENEILGYLNKFDASSGDLIASGALTPFRDDDRASEVIYKMRSGVPYESSINFGGDGIVVEEIPEGQMVHLNNREFVGPLTVIRQFPLRGVAICPYGADANTPANLLSDSKTHFSFTTIKGENQMSDVTAVDAEAKVEEVAATVEPTPAVEAEAPKVELAVEATKEELAAPAESPASVVAEETTALPVVELSAERKEFAQMVCEFGAELAATYFASNVSLAQARADHYEALKNEVKSLKDEIAKLSAVKPTPSTAKDTGPDVGVVITDNAKNAAFEARKAEFAARGLSDGMAAYAASINIVSAR